MSDADKVREIISDQTGCKVEEITDDASVVNDLGADSLDVVEIVMALEQEFDIEIPDEDMEKLAKVGDVIEYIKNKKR